MKDMKCIECVLKHLATALSFGKEIISGHSIGNDLDHRIDFLGQITNAEQHLQLIDNFLFIEISNFRKGIQEKNVIIQMSDLQFLRELYLKVESLNQNIKPIIINNPILEFDPDVVYLNVTSKEYFDLSYKTVKKYLKNYNKIYVYNSSIDLGEYQDVIELNDQELTQSIIIIKQNMGLNKEVNAKQIPTTYSRSLNKELIQEIKISEKLLLNYDNLKLQTISFEKFNELKNKNYPLSVYHYENDVQIGEIDQLYTVDIRKEICCSTKRELQNKQYVRWINQEAFTSFKQYYEKNEKNN